MRQRVALTGLSSFTGCHIAKALSEEGFELLCLQSQNKENYSDSLISKRIAYSGQKNFAYEAPFGTENFLKAIEDFKPSTFINHGAAIKGYRSPEFDGIKSSADSLMNIKQVFEVFKKIGLKRLVHSGTVFEPNSTEAGLSPYGLSKATTAESLRYHSSLNHIEFSKIYIPNPIGLYENSDRLIPVFIKTWLEGKTAKLSQPYNVVDNIPAEWLAKIYSDEAKFTGRYRERMRHPSSFVMTNQRLVEILQEKIKERFKIESKVEFVAQTTAPVIRFSSEPVAELSSTDEVNRFWSRLLDSYQKDSH